MVLYVVVIIIRTGSTINYSLSSLAVSGGEPVASAVTFTQYTQERVNWTIAKSRCENWGQRLAVLDTPEKLTAFRKQM